MSSSLSETDEDETQYEDKDKVRRIISQEKFNILSFLPINCWNGEKQRSKHPHKRNILGCHIGCGFAQWEDDNGQIYFLASKDSVMRIDYRLEIYEDGSTEMKVENKSVIKEIGGSGVVNDLYNEVLAKIEEKQ